MNVLLLYPFAPAKFQRYYNACQKNGWQLTVLTTEQSPVPVPEDCRVITSDRIYDHADKVAPLLQSESFDAIVAFSEFSVLLGERLCAMLGHDHNRLDAVEAYRNKYKMRQLLAKGEIAQPEVYALIEHADQDLSAVRYPAIVKPVDGFGSTHVRLVENERELKEACAPILELTYWELFGLPLAGMALVEEPILGPEFSAEVILQDGVCRFLANTRKIVGPLPDCDEVGHIMPAGFSAKEEETVRATVMRIADVFGYRTGMMHLEYKLIDGVPTVIEIGFRIAGDRIADLVERRYGHDLEELLIRLRAGSKLDELPGFEPDEQAPFVAVKFLFPTLGELGLVDGITVLEERRRKASHSGDETAPIASPTSAFNRVGHVLCQADDQEKLRQFVQYVARE
ncbi:ATP-grasp domain-containing protein [Haliangium ochraceum]|uniref:ATP-grasp domain-containing protein n=1 Tax=Haliangium ochraceum (strain DSM 14365 / JCM 11303 / SMP-2) TaxID=502025 RepID=D0LLD2_HALO1|nr:ATP-grasp domain-containing protein [Haliangium ochraceum]ACY18628.1 protein of unknown function DUF201 [Haliangium ochraceum DSM 14365]